jgi:hypothetical protein
MTVRLPLRVADSVMKGQVQPVLYLSNILHIDLSPIEALLFMHSSTLFVHGSDKEGYERALRALPLRTGTPNPEWMVIGRDADKLGWGGVLGAG